MITNNFQEHCDTDNQLQKRHEKKFFSKKNLTQTPQVLNNKRIV